MEIPILYEDSDILAVDKPAGLVVHPDGRTQEPVLTDWILKNYPKTKVVGEMQGDIARPGIVHRLDRGTSGVILVAKTKDGHACLKEQFQNQQISKKYIAIVHGDMKDKYGIIDRPIGRSPSDFRKWSASRGARGEMRPAETWWTLLGVGRDDKGIYSLVEVEPKTGRTHQIRVHFKAIQHPIACDELYSPEKQCTIGMKRTALHALSISFKNCAGKSITVKSLLPSDFQETLGELGLAEVAKNTGIC